MRRTNEHSQSTAAVSTAVPAPASAPSTASARATAAVRGSIECRSPTIADLLRRFGGVVFADAGERRGCAIDPAETPLDARATDLRIHSAAVHPNEAFAALPGLRADGARYVPDALARGASLVLTLPTRSVDDLLRGTHNASGRFDPDAVLWLHPRAQEIAGEVAAQIHGRPTDDVAVAGVTGTNGKTSVCHVASQLLAGAGHTPAILGTAGHVIAGERGRLHLDARNTTPDATEVHRLLARHQRAGGDVAAMEVSSHGLVHGRLSGIELRVGAFTNLSHEHLDFHHTMERYLRAKAKLWERVTDGGTAVVFGDSPASESMAESAKQRGLRVVRVRVDGEHASGDTLTARIVRFDGDGSWIDLRGLGLDARSLRIPLRGQHNIENVVVAAAIARGLGAEAEAIVEALPRVVAAPGRLEPVAVPPAAGAGGAFDVLVDYAHSPDALERVLGALRRDLDGKTNDRGRLICVFGCGGDRDRAKREPMGRAAGRLADVSIVTSDNPRSEDPAAIADEVTVGVDREDGRRLVELDRRIAIERAVDIARPGDVVLIAGKGHENTQTTAMGSIPFDDRVVAAEALHARFAGSAG